MGNISPKKINSTALDLFENRVFAAQPFERGDNGSSSFRGGIDT